MQLYEVFCLETSGTVHIDAGNSNTVRLPKAASCLFQHLNVLASGLNPAGQFLCRLQAQVAAVMVAAVLLYATKPTVFVFHHPQPCCGVNVAGQHAHTTSSLASKGLKMLFDKTLPNACRLQRHTGAGEISSSWKVVPQTSTPCKSRW